MFIPFPSLTPRLIDSKWFNADSPCDEENEISALEDEYHNWFNSVGDMYKKKIPLGNTAPEPMEEEAESDEEEGNEESDESEDTHDEDDDEELRTYSPTVAPPNNNLPDGINDLSDALLLNDTPDAGVS